MFGCRRNGQTDPCKVAAQTVVSTPDRSSHGSGAIVHAGILPLALLTLTAMPRAVAALGTLLDRASAEEAALARTRQALKWTTVLLLVGHGALGIADKALLATHYTTIGLPTSTTVLVGWFEIVLALALAVRPIAGLLIFIAAWKLATEFLFVTAGAPIWEFVERAGSYAAPLALALLTRVRPI